MGCLHGESESNTRTRTHTFLIWMMVLQPKLLQRSRNQKMTVEPSTRRNTEEPCRTWSSAEEASRPSGTWFWCSEGNPVCSNRDGQRGVPVPHPRVQGPDIVTILVTFGSAYFSRSLKTNPCNHTDTGEYCNGFCTYL